MSIVSFNTSDSMVATSISPKRKGFGHHQASKAAGKSVRASAGFCFRGRLMMLKNGVAHVGDEEVL